MYHRSSSYRSFVPIDTLAASPSPVPTVIDWNDSSDFDDSDSSSISVLMANDHSRPASPSRSVSPAPHHTRAVPLLTRTSFPPDSATSQSIRTPSPASTDPATTVMPLFVRNSWGSEMSPGDVASVLGIRAQDAQPQRQSPKEPRQSLDLQQILSSQSSSSHSLFTPPTQAQAQIPTPPRQGFGPLVERMQAASLSDSPPPTPSPEPPAYMEESAVLTDPPSLANTPPPQQQQQPRPSTRQPALPSWFMDRYIAPPVMHTGTFSPTPYPVGVPPRPPSDTSYLSYTRPSPSPYQSNTNDRHVNRAPPSREMSPSRPLSSASSSSSGQLFATPRAPSHSSGSGRFNGRSTTTYSVHEPYLPPPNFGLFEGSTVSTETPSPSWSPAFVAPALHVRIPSLSGAPSSIPVSRAGVGAPSPRTVTGTHPSRTNDTLRRPPLARSVSTPSPRSTTLNPTPTFPKRARFAPNQYYRSPEAFPPAGGSGAQDTAQPYSYGNNTTSEPPFWDTPPPPSPPPLAPPSVIMNQPGQRGVPPPTSSMWEHIGQNGHGGVNANTPGSHSFAQTTPRANPTNTNTNNNARHPSDTTPGSRPGYYHTPPLGPIPFSTPSWYLPSLSWPPSAAASQIRLVPPLSLPAGNQINAGGPGVCNVPAQQPVNGPTPWQQQPGNGPTQQPGSATAWGQQQQQQTVNASTPWSNSSATPWLLQTPGSQTPWQPLAPAPWQQPSSASWQPWQAPPSASWQSVNTPWQQSINGPWQQQQQGGLSTPWQRANNESMEQARRQMAANGSTFGQHTGASGPCQRSVNATPWQQPVNAPSWQQPANATPWLGHPREVYCPINVWPTQLPVDVTSYLGSTPRRRDLPPRPLLNYHPRFTFPDGTVLFKVEDVTYKVHRYFFDQHSSFFQTLLQSYPPYSGAATVDPIFLQDVTRTDFERLLSVFYPLNFSEPDLKTTAEWTSVLILSSKWVFTQLRLRAIKELEKLAGPTDRILLAKKYTIKEWYVPAYKELCVRRQAMTLEDGQKLGLDTVIKVWELQQEFECLDECCDEMHVAKVKERFGLE